MKKIGIWEKIPKSNLTKYKKIKIYDAYDDSEIVFDSHQYFKSELGYIIKYTGLYNALLKKIFEKNIRIIENFEIHKLYYLKECIFIRNKQKNIVIKTNFVIGTDGKFSAIKRFFKFK